MAQRAPIRFDSVRSDRPQSAPDWSELRPASASSRPGSPPKPLPAIFWIVVVLITGAAIVLFYMRYSSETRAPAGLSKATHVVPMSNVSSGRSSTGDAIRVASTASKSRSSTREQSAPDSAARVFEQVPPSPEVDVVTSSGHYAVRLANLSYNVNLKTGAVQLDPAWRNGVNGGYPIRGQAGQGLTGNGDQKVVLSVTTDRLGTVREWHVLSGAPELITVAVDAVRHWRFTASEIPEQHVLTITVSFRTLQ